MPVLGIGGLFFRARDPDALTAWYRDHLGVGAGCSATAGDADPWTWRTTGGPVVFAPFKADTDYFAADRQFMINLRVSDLDALLVSLAAAGIEVRRDPRRRFARPRQVRAHSRPGGECDRTVGSGLKR